MLKAGDFIPVVNAETETSLKNVGFQKEVIFVSFCFQAVFTNLDISKASLTKMRSRENGTLKK